MVTTTEILDKQSEILSHQKHFNLVLAIATCFLVLIYALKEIPSRFSTAYFKVISIIIVVILIMIFIFLIKERYPEKIFRLLKKTFG